MTADLLKQLPPVSFRGRQYAVTSRSASFQHRQIEHEIGRRNQDLIEPTGPRNIRFQYTFSMRDELFRGPYNNLFTEGLDQLRADFRDRTPGELIDPLYGSFRVVPVSWNDDTDVTKRDGTDVQVEFLYSPEDDDAEDEDPNTLQAVARERDDLSTSVAELEQEFNEALAVSPVIPVDESGIKITDIPGLITDVIDFANGVGQQVIGANNRADAELERIAFKTRRLENTMSVLSSPEAWKIQADGRSLRDKANQARKNQSQIRPVITRTVTQSLSVASLAAELGVSVDALLKANPSLSSRPMVPVGAVVVVPSK